MKMCGRVGMYFCECLNCSLEKEVSGQLQVSSSLPPTYKQYKFNYMLEGEKKRGTYRVLVGKPEGKNHLEDPEVDGRIILIGSSRRGMGGIDWIYRTQNKDKWRAVVKVVMNLRVS